MDGHLCHYPIHHIFFNHPLVRPLARSRNNHPPTLLPMSKQQPTKQPSTTGTHEPDAGATATHTATHPHPPGATATHPHLPGTLVPGASLTVILYTGPFYGWDLPEVGGLPLDNDKRTYISCVNQSPLFTLRLTFNSEFSILVRQLPVQPHMCARGLVEAQLRGLAATLCAAHMARGAYGWDFLWRHVQDHLPADESAAFGCIGASVLRMLNGMYTCIVPAPAPEPTSHGASSHDATSSSSSSSSSSSHDRYSVTTVFTSDPAMFLTQQHDKGLYPFVHWLNRVPDVLDFLDDDTVMDTATATAVRTYTTVVTPNLQLMETSGAFALGAGRPRGGVVCEGCEGVGM